MEDSHKQMLISRKPRQIEFSFQLVPQLETRGIVGRIYHSNQTITEMDYSLIYLTKTNKRNKEQLKILTIFQSLQNNTYSKSTYTCYLKSLPIILYRSLQD